MSIEDYNRPRRGDPQTVAYLRSLPLDEIAAQEEIRTYLNAKRRQDADTSSPDGNDDDEGDSSNHDDEYPQSLAASHAAITEIGNELASLACDEYGSQSIETIARITALFGRSDRAARRLLAGLAGYHLHLACHRFGSHVVQTILICAASAAPSSDSGDDGDGDGDRAARWLEEEEVDNEDGEDELPSVTELVLAAADELLPHSRQLAVHVCGSHVLRTLLCVLGGVELVPSRLGGNSNNSQRLELGGTRRGKAKGGKKSKKKKKKNIPEEIDGGAGGSGGTRNELMQLVEHSRIDTRSAGVKDALRSAVATLTGADAPSGPGELQQLACHPSAGPLLAVLLRVLTHSSNPSVPAKPSTAETISSEQHAIKADFDGKAVSDHRLGVTPPEPMFAAESDASKFAKAIVCWDDNADDNAKQPYAGDVIYGMSGEPRGSHVLETILRLSDDAFHDKICRDGRFFEPDSFQEYAEHDVSNFVLQTLFVTVRTKGQADELLNCLEPLISSGYIVDKSKRRGGLLWRAAEMCAKFKVCQNTLLVAIRSGFSVLAGSVRDSSSIQKRDEATEEKGKDGKKMRHKKRKRDEEGSLLSMEECIPLLIDLKPPQLDGGRALLDVAGARTIYNLLHFAPKLCGGTLEGITKGFSSQEIEWIANDGLGSRCILDAIMEGPTKQNPFSGAVKDVLEKLGGRWVALSVERVGHHLVQNLFKALHSLDDRAILVAELAHGINRLGSNAMGRKVMTACAVKEFLEGEAVWKEAVMKQIRREEILKELLEDVVDKESGGGDGGGGEGKRRRKRKKKTKNEAS
mmetsp:Transcript_2632/g.6070  ORF Transcript_2632/g.6070 Transcript_2632/m.6070 type:complete len:805 (-) Transcript_2632:84-2498(-)|eukprot:CAMPEP_0178492186 /NCGR_PEP_ID=MMETSP0696-20121128/11800_1 /TAXON_ID=265572 /ORGANISM="Extubocellulus spinifer, Strain CCMP396" /LENGTH=804 /DNA_ID=CAMNT_0020120087 /DNA_START=46 /DNA_END=2460 /DNA_ORIENTATION=-